MFKNLKVRAFGHVARKVMQNIFSNMLKTFSETFSHDGGRYFGSHFRLQINDHNLLEVVELSFCTNKYVKYRFYKIDFSISLTDLTASYPVIVIRKFKFNLSARRSESKLVKLKFWMTCSIV